MVRNRRFSRSVSRLCDFPNWDDGWTTSIEGVILMSYREVKDLGCHEMCEVIPFTVRTSVKG